MKYNKQIIDRRRAQKRKAAMINLVLIGALIAVLVIGTI